MTDRRPEPGPILVRVYDPPEHGRYRVLVDGLWPRGLSRERAAIDEWLRDIAPSAELRKWFGHDPRRFAEFVSRYRVELDEPARAQALATLTDLADSRPLAVVTSTKDVEHSHAALLVGLIT